MNTKILTVFFFMSVLNSHGQEFGKFIPIEKEFSTLIAPNAKLEILADTFEWSEGPIWVKKGGFLLFSDVPKNTIYKWTRAEGVSVFMNPSGYTGVFPYSNEPGSNGLTISNDGELLLCEHGDRRISKVPIDKRGGKVTLSAHWEGKRYNSPNDLVQSKAGDIYFTDPPYGLPEHENDPSREIDLFGVYRISPKGVTTLEIKDLTRPNGVALSPDHKILYVAQSDTKAYIMKYPIKTDGSLGAGTLFFDASYLNAEGKSGAPDGLKVDKDGNVFTSGPGGVLVLNKNGKLLGRIEIPAPTSNLAWGEDGSTLFITSDMFLIRLETKTKGANF
jgi:gluconolactonase